MAVSDVEPRVDSADPAAQLVAYLDYDRGVVERKTADLTVEELRTSLLPSGWTPVQLQEYARHAGHLDVARELADGATGE